MAKLYNTKHYHRDLSWLRFNHRVLQEAADERNQIYDRLKFLAIFSSNLDEFFRVRVSDIRQIRGLDRSLRKKLITKPNKVLKEIRNQVDAQQEEFGLIFRSQIIPALQKENIHLIGHEEFSATHKEVAKSYYEDHIKPKIKIERHLIHPKESVFIENEALYLVAFLSEDSFVLVKIPEDLPRFFVFPVQQAKHTITFVDDILKYALRLHPKKEREIKFFAIKKSRDGELYIDDEFSGNLLNKIKMALPQRETGQATRLLVDMNMPYSQQQALMKALDFSMADLIQGARYHNFKDFFDFPNPTNKVLVAPELSPLEHPVLSASSSILNTIEKKDVLLHFPYQSFDPVIRLLEEAADDPDVRTLKITLYRAAKKSRLNDAISRAARNGKKVVVFIEVKARFDEKNNMEWGSIFEENGAKVIYSFPAIKVHSKIFYIERVGDGISKKFAYIGTGNFNEKTARVYTDFGLLTANNEITADVHKVFQVLEGSLILPKPKKLLLSPFTAREVFETHIRSEIAMANLGKKAYIIAKMNSLQDKKMIDLLYEASNAGVKIRLVVRGICCLVAGIKGQSENILITSILDRYLEHGRVYIFGNGGDEKIFIGSADWMTRNLSHRIEVITPVLDPDLKRELRHLVDYQIYDNVKSRIIDANQENRYVSSNAGPRRAQLATYGYFKEKLEKSIA